MQLNSESAFHLWPSSETKIKCFDELICSIQQKLRIWRWRDFTIIERIQIVKTFIILIFLYHASLISVNREFVKDVNEVIFDFFWKGKDKIKRAALISVIENRRLKAPHLDSIIETQRILCCKKLASDQPGNWKKNSTALSWTCRG